MGTICLSDASLAQIKSAARINGLAVTGEAKESLVASLRNLGVETIEIKDGDQPSSVPAIKKSATTNNDNWYTIIIPKQGSENGGNEPVLVSPQGKNFMIPHGVNCEVQEKHVECLRNAVRGEPEMVDSNIVSMNDVPRFPFQIIKGPYKKQDAT